MSRNAMVMLATAMALATVLAATAMASAHIEDAPEAEPVGFIGHWYVIDAYGDIEWLLSTGGELWQSDGMDVFDDSYGRGFYGKYMGHAMTGMITDHGRLEAAVSMGDMTTFIDGYISDGGIAHMTGTYVIIDRNGVISDTGTYVLQMSQIWNATPARTDIVDIRGGWGIVQAFWPTGDEARIPDYNANVVQDRNRCAITIRDSLRPVSEVNMVMYMIGDILHGKGIDTVGNQWSLIFDGHTMMLDLCLCNDADNVPDLCRIVLDRDGSGEGGESIGLDLLGTSWRNVNSMTYHPDGSTIANVTAMYMSFAEQNGDTYAVNLSFKKSQHMSVNLTDGDVITIHAWYSDNPTLMTLYGALDRETMTIHIVLTSWQDGALCLSEMTFEECRVVDDVDITGHWYLVRTIGYDASDELSILGLWEGHMKYDLDIYGVSEGLLYGRFSGSLITGSYLDGILKIHGDTDLGLCTITGHVVDDSTMIFTDTYFGNPIDRAAYTETWMTVMSRDLGGGSPEPVTSDITGEWRLSYSKRYDGSSVELEDAVLNIATFQENVLIGTIKGPTIDSVVKGSLLPYGDATSATGVLLHEDGTLWSMTVRDDKIVIKMSTSDNVVPTMSAWAVQAVFTRSGEPIVDDVLYPDMVGTWRSESMTTIDENGSVELGGIPYIMEITGQDGFGLVGTTWQPGAEGVIAISMTMNPNGQMTLQIASDFMINDGLDLGYGWLDDEGGMYIVETYINAAGMQTTQLTYMTMALG